MKRFSNKQREALNRYNFSIRNCNDVRQNYTKESIEEWQTASNILKSKLFDETEKKHIEFRQNYIVHKQRGANRPDYHN